jgi:hypothetical protein
MRKGLEKINGDRTKFMGVFERYGTKTNFKGYPEKTILLKNVKQGSKTVTDHIWFSMTKGFEALGELKEGDIIEFHARVKEYYKGYAGYKEEVQWEKPIELDYKLSHPTKIRRYHEDTSFQIIPEQSN